MTDAKKQSDGTNGQYEKVEKGLECPLIPHYDTCKDCPYFSEELDEISLDFEYRCDIGQIERDALSLIRQQQARIAELEAAQTARVMTLEDAAKSDVCWLEVRDMDRVMPCRIRWYYNSYFIKLFEGAPERFTENEYGTGLRCWTLRPTDEQRKAVPWNAKD